LYRFNYCLTASADALGLNRFKAQLQAEIESIQSKEDAMIPASYFFKGAYREAWGSGGGEPPAAAGWPQRWLRPILALARVVRSKAAHPVAVKREASPAGHALAGSASSGLKRHAV
jgi:hypothetical protein